MTKRDHGRDRRNDHGRDERDFWRAWREERRRQWEAQGGQPHEHPPGKPPFSRRERGRRWRQFFHEYTGEWPEEHWAFGGRRFSPWQKGDDQFNPFVAMMLSKGGGLLPLLVMQSLQDRPRYGNDIMDHITELTRGQWLANPGAIYPLMTILEEQGLVTGQWEDPVKRTVRVYELTESGSAELERLRAIVLPKLEEAIEVMDATVEALSTENTNDVL